jgi:hypothetical protein
MLLWLLCCTFALAPALARAAANDDVPVVGSTDELFQLLHAEQQPEDPGVSIDDALKDHLKGGEVDEGTYPPSDLWERQFNSWREPPPDFTYSGRTRFRYSTDKVSHVTKWEKELELNFKYGDWSAYTRFSDLNEFAYQNDPMRWQRAWVTYHGHNYRATVGSVGTVFGRGLALNMFEDRLLEFDNEAEGAKVDFNIGKADGTVIAGTRKTATDQRDSTVAGLQLHTKLSRHFDAGGYYVDVLFPDAKTWTPATPNMHHNRMVGGDVTVRSGKLTAYAELMQLMRPAEPWNNLKWQTNGADGHAVYTTASYAGNGYSITGEYKDYFHVDQPFGVLPTVRRWEEKAQATPDDDKGYNFQLLMTPKNGSSWLFTYGQDGPHTQVPRPYTELIGTYTSPTKHGFGYIAENFIIDDEGELWKEQRLTLNHKLDSDWTSSLVLQRKRHDTVYTHGYAYLLFDTELAYKSMFDLVFTQETSNQEKADPDQWDLWEVKYHPNDRQELNLTYGSRRAGYVCSGGVCRLEPEFDGTKVEYLLRF